ncbi:MAG: hypothetical protein ACRDSO_01215, partial [Pseudonocardiaceae bacterium]
KAFYSDDAANRHVNPHWARYMSNQLGELLRDSIRHEQTTPEAESRSFLACSSNLSARWRR